MSSTPSLAPDVNRPFLLKVVLICIRAALGGAAGWGLSIPFAALLGAVLGLGAAVMLSSISPLDAGSGPVADGPPMLVFVLALWGASLAPPVGSIAGAITLSTRSPRLGIGAALLSSVIPVVRVCFDPNWYGGVELGSLSRCAEPAVTWFSIAASAGILVVLTIHCSARFIDRQFNAWRSRTRAETSSRGRLTTR